MQPSMTPQQLRAAALVAPGRVLVDEMPNGIVALTPTLDDAYRSGVYRIEIDQHGHVAQFLVGGRGSTQTTYDDLIRRDLEAQAEIAAGIV